MATGPERRKRRSQEIQQRLVAIRIRTEELRVRRQDDDTGPVSIRERLASAQRHAVASQAAATSALAAVVRAFRRSAESHVDAARQHERSAAAGSGDSDEHERRAESHRAAADADTREADRAQLHLQHEEAGDAHEPGTDPMLKTAHSGPEPGKNGPAAPSL